MNYVVQQAIPKDCESCGKHPYLSHEWVMEHIRNDPMGCMPAFTKVVHDKPYESAEFNVEIEGR